MLYDPVWHHLFDDGGCYLNWGAQVVLVQFCIVLSIGKHTLLSKFNIYIWKDSF